MRILLIALEGHLIGIGVRRGATTSRRDTQLDTLQEVAALEGLRSILPRYRRAISQDDLYGRIAGSLRQAQVHIVVGTAIGERLSIVDRPSSRIADDEGDSRHSFLQRSLIGREGEGRDLVVVDLEVLQLYLLTLTACHTERECQKAQSCGDKGSDTSHCFYIYGAKDTCSDHQSYVERLALKPTPHYNSKSQRYKE